MSEEEFFARGSKALGLLNEDSQVYLIISGQTGAIPMSNHRFKRYGQTYKDYRVKDAGLVLSLDLAGNIVSVFNSLQPITGFYPSPTLSQEASREIAVEGIDIIFIGPYDLSQSLDITGQIDHPLVIEKMMEIIDKCIQKGVAVGTFAETIENARKWRDLGIKYISYSVDTGIFYDACQDIIDKIKVYSS